MLGDQPVTAGGDWDYKVGGKDLVELSLDSYPLEISDSFSFG